MKTKIITISFIIITQLVSAQIVFNRIIGDTVTNITSSVITLDTGYVYITGTNNGALKRCFALTYVDINGNKIWKKEFGDNTIEFWEGWSNNLKKYPDNSICLAGSVLNEGEEKRGIHITEFDSVLNLKSQNITYYDTVYKKAYHCFKSNDNNYYITGSTYDYISEKYRSYLLKADSTGDYLWHELLGSNEYEYGSYIIQTSDSSIITAGTSWFESINNTRWYIVSSDTAGNINWERYYGRENYDNGYVSSLCETCDSNVLACGCYPVAKYGGGTGVSNLREGNYLLKLGEFTKQISLVK